MAAPTSSPAAAPAGEKWVVAHVRSGDSLVLWNVATEPPTEKVIGLEFIDVPRLPPPQSKSVDVPWAWEAKECVRKLVGASNPPCVFTSFRSNERRTIEYGLLTVNGVDVASHLVENGFATVKQRPAGGVAEREGQILDTLVAKEKEAQSSKKGMFSGDLSQKHVRNVQWPGPEEVSALATRLTDKTTSFIVEQVSNGSLLRGWLVPESVGAGLSVGTWNWITLQLTGIRCPTFGAIGPDGASEPKPFAKEARFLTERSMLGRNVNVVLEGKDPRSNDLCGSVVRGGKCFQEMLLSKGLAKTFEPSISQTRFEKDLRAAELAAQERRLALWVDYKPPVSVLKSADPKAIERFNGEVVAVVGGDMIAVLPDGADIKAAAAGDSDPTIRVVLSHIKCRKDFQRSTDPERPDATQYSNFTWEAKECARTKLIGRRVEVITDWVPTGPRDGQNGPPVPAGPPRVFATVILRNGPDAGKNAAAILLREGLATLQGTETGKPKELVEAENLARQERKGLHAFERMPAPTPPPKAAASPVTAEPEKEPEEAAAEPEKVEEEAAGKGGKGKKGGAQKPDGKKADEKTTEEGAKGKKGGAQKPDGKKADEKTEEKKEAEKPAPKAKGAKGGKAAEEKQPEKAKEKEKEKEEEEKPKPKGKAQQAKPKPGGKGGLKSLKEAPVVFINELNKLNEKKAKTYLATFQRGGAGRDPPKLKATIEVVLSATRYRVYIQRENCVCTLVLTGICAPSTARTDNKKEQPVDDPYAKETNLFAKLQYLHRDAEVEIDGCDRKGNFLGAIFVGGENVAVALTKAGYACSTGQASRSRHGAQIQEAEKTAKALQLHIWNPVTGGLPLKRREADEMATDPTERTQTATLNLNFVSAGTQPSQWRSVTPVWAHDPVTVYVQSNDATGQRRQEDLKKLLGRISSFDQMPHCSPKANDVVVARFSQDKQLYRARVTRVLAQGKRLVVEYIDYGNTEEIPTSEVRSSSEIANSLTTLPRLATKLFLAMVIPPREGDKNAHTDAVNCIQSYFSKPVYVATAYTAENNTKEYVLIAEDNTGKNQLNTLLANEGLVRVDTRVGDTLAVAAKNSAVANDLLAVYTGIKKAQAHAIKERQGTWRFGEVTDDD